MPWLDHKLGVLFNRQQSDGRWFCLEDMSCRFVRSGCNLATEREFAVPLRWERGRSGTFRSIESGRLAKPQPKFPAIAGRFQIRSVPITLARREGSNQKM